MKKWTVIEYVSVAREYWNIEAESEEEAIELVMDDPDKEPDNQEMIKRSELVAEEGEGK